MHPYPSRSMVSHPKNIHLRKVLHILNSSDELRPGKARSNNRSMQPQPKAAVYRKAAGPVPRLSVSSRFTVDNLGSGRVYTESSAGAASRGRPVTPTAAIFRSKPDRNDVPGTVSDAREQWERHRAGEVCPPVSRRAKWTRDGFRGYEIVLPTPRNSGKF